MTDPSSPLISVNDLSVTFATESGTVRAVQNVSWDVHPGEVLGVVGESGSGKSVSVKSLLGLLASPPATVSGGPVTFEGRDLLTLRKRERRRIRGREISMIFQDPMSAFNPVQSIGKQITEAIRVHDRSVTRAAARTRVIELLDMVGVPSPDVRFSQFPYEYSGGMLQRAMIAMAMANRPKLIIADEPTTALDVTIQAQIVELFEALLRETSAAMILITHDLGLIAELADRVLVMYAGRVVEASPIIPLFAAPQHPYTLGLLASLPRIDTRLETLMSIPGQPPSLSSPPSGCAFHPRCHLAQGREICRTEVPTLVGVGPGRTTACHFHDEMDHETDSVSSEIGIDIRKGVAE